MSYYGQIHFQERVGNSNLLISEAGCFVTGFCNELAKVGITVDPATLDAFFTEHNVFTYDATDKANDDLYWNSVTSYCPQLVVSQIGGEGFPSADLAIVKFYYQSVQHPWLDEAKTQKNMVTHFCAVNSAADHSIIDSWDGFVKTPAEYEHVYGTPVAYATYTYHTTATIPASLPPAVLISAPCAIASTPQPPAPAAVKELFLPASVSVWHVYNPGGPWTLPHAIHVLDPAEFGGLTYAIVGNPAQNIYLIDTQMFGRVAIYAGPDTVAQFITGGHGEGEDTTTPAPDTGIPVSEVVPAPVPAAPTAPLVPETPSIVYSLVDGGPLSLITKEGAQKVNFVSGTVVETPAPGTEFIAYGKARFPDNTAYYMRESEFGQADTTQHTIMTVGIKTGDLQLTPFPETATEVAPAVNGAEVIPVSVIDTPAPASGAAPATFNPTLPWQGTFKAFTDNEVKTYVVKENMKVYSFVTGNDMLPVSKDTPVEVIGTFIYGGSRMYLPKSSAPKDLGGKDTWYGFPVTSLKPQSADTMPFNTGDDINQIEAEALQLSKVKKGIIPPASAGSFLHRLKRKN